MNKILVYVIVLLAIASISYFLYKRYSTPSFRIIQETPSKHEGVYEFDGTRNPYGSGSQFQKGSNGWGLDVKMQPDGKTKFDLHKEGKFVKTLAVK